jgi:hypothetical protein
VQRAHADLIATPAVAAPADRIAPVPRLGVVAHGHRLARAAARGLGDHRQRRHVRGARVDRLAQDRAVEQRQLAEIVDRAEVLRGQAALIQQLAIERGVAMAMAQHPAQQPDLEVAQGTRGPALGFLQVAQQRHGRTAASGLERGKQRLGE